MFLITLKILITSSSDLSLSLIAAASFGLNEDLYPFPIWRGDSSDVMKQGDWIEIHLRLFFSPPLLAAAALLIKLIMIQAL